MVTGLTALRRRRAGLGASGTPAWLAKLRGEALERFLALDFPTTRDEEWRFTSVAPIAERAFSVASPVPVVQGFSPAVPSLAAPESGPELPPNWRGNIRLKHIQ